MPIAYDFRTKMFFLQAKDMSYVMRISPTGYLCHVYWGKKVRNLHPEAAAADFTHTNLLHIPELSDPTFSLETALLEYPSYGNSDFRRPAFQLRTESGATLAAPKYRCHRIYDGKPALEGLPATYAEKNDEAQTLEITLCDGPSRLEITLFYTAFSGRNVLARSARLKNGGSGAFTILQALSASVDMPAADYEMLQLSGAWARERHICRRPLAPGMQSVESMRGSSSHQHNPFLALLSPGAGEKNGEVYAASLLYSGNFFAGAEVSQYGSARFSIGINPFEFSWKLLPGQTFQTPEAVLVYAEEGLGEMSRTFHSLYRERLCRGKFRDAARPVLINNWEATYFDFDSKRFCGLPKARATWESSFWCWTTVGLEEGITTDRRWATGT